MKKSLGLLMIVIAVIAMAFVSCDASTAPKADAVGEVVLDSSQSRDIDITSANSNDVESLYWYYNAVKNDNGLFNTGATGGFVPVKKTEAGVADEGLQNAKLGLFSYGNWTFTFYAFKTSLDGVTASSPLTDTSNVSSTIVYFGSQTIEVNKDKNFLNLTLNEGAGLTTEIKFDNNEGVWFSHENIEEGMTGANSIFTLSVVDRVNGVPQGEITAGTALFVPGNDDNSVKPRVTFKGIAYTTLPSGGIAEGKHVMTFTLTQKGIADTNTNIATVATYELVYTVSKGLTYTVKGNLTSAEVQGEVAVGSYAKSVPETTASMVLPVESSESKKVTKATEVSTLDLSVKYPADTVLTTETNTAGSGDNVTADATIGFKLNPEVTGGISTVDSNQDLTKYELILNVAQTNKTLVEVSKFIGKNLEIEGVYHSSTLVLHKDSEDLKDGEEYYDYSPTDGVLKLYVKHASSIDVVTKKALAVAEIGDEKFTTLQAAIEAAVDGDTISLIDNIVSDSNVLKINKSINIDGNNKTITLSCDTANAAIKIPSGNNGLTINISDLTINTNQGGIWDFGTNTTLNLTGVNILGATYWALYHNGSYSGFTCNAVNSTFTTPEDADADCTAIYISGTTKYKQKLNLTGCTVKGVTGIEGKYTDMNLKNCTIESLVDNVDFDQNNNGSTADGFAVVSTDNSMSPSVPKPTAVITIDGGEYKGAIGLATIYNQIEYPEFSEASYVFKNGPTINNTSLAGKIAYCFENNTAYDTLADAISGDPDNGISGAPDKGRVIILDDVDLTGSGGSEQINCLNDLILDLNGHTIKGSIWSGDYSSNADGTRLILIDSQFNPDDIDNSNGQIYSKFRFGNGGAMMQANAVTVWQHAVTINSGKYVSNNVAVVCQVQNTDAPEGIIINGGYFGGTDDLIEGVSLPGPVGGCVEAVIGTVTINGGTFKAAQYGSVIIAKSGDSKSDTVVNINGGTFEGACMFDFGDDHSSKTIVNVKGGKFTVKNPDGSDEISETSFAYDNYTHAALVNNDMFELNIMGGTFNYDPTAYVDAANYNVTKNGSTWTVTAK